MRRQLIAVLACVPLAAWSHGDWPPRHGGVMNVGGETSFEMVRHRAGLLFYVSDHGEDLPTAGSKATLSLKGAATQRHFEGRARNTNEVFFAGAVPTPDEAVMIKLTLDHGAIVVGRFPAKKAATKAAN